MKINSVRQEDGSIKFDHYVVKKRSDNYYAICDSSTGYEVTSGTSMGNACKKAKLLETGYLRAIDAYREWYI